jgi:hypothetical protein
MPPKKARRIYGGDIEYRRKGKLKGWETTEICTNNFQEVARYLRQFNPNTTRVYISAQGTVYVYKGKKGNINNKRGLKNQHIALTSNILLRRLGNADVVERMYQKRKAFLLPDYTDLTDAEQDELDEDAYDIDMYCIRTREAIT